MIAKVFVRFTGSGQGGEKDNGELAEHFAMMAEPQQSKLFWVGCFLTDFLNNKVGCDEA